MKRYFVVLTVLCCLLVLTVGCTPLTDDSPETTTTTTTTTNTEGIGGGGDWDYSFAYDFAFNVSDYMKDFVDANTFDTWCSQFEHFDMGGTRNAYEYNYYEFINEFSIPRKKMEDICAQYKEMFPEIDLLTSDQIDKLYTGTRLEVYQYFANPHAVMVGIHAYSPEWLATHTANDYRKAGITYDMLTEKLNDILSTCALPEERAHIRTQYLALKK